MTRCLILGCTQLKRSTDVDLPAIDRYNGPTFRVLRKFLDEADAGVKNVDLYVLSAHYGLIAGGELIQDYDLRMTSARAAILREQTLKRFETIMTKAFDDVLILLSGIYLQTLQGFEVYVPPGTKVTVVTASSGKQLNILKSWLYQQSFEPQVVDPHDIPVTGQAILKGKTVAFTPEQILALGRTALAQSSGEHTNFRDWHTLIDGEKVSTKWLVSVLSGLGVSEFQASDARRVLSQLGIEVYRGN